MDVSVDEAALQAIADSTSGEYFAATTGDELADAYADIGGTVGSETVEREVGTWFLGFGLALLVLPRPCHSSGSAACRDRRVRFARTSPTALASARCAGHELRLLSSRARTR